MKDLANVTKQAIYAVVFIIVVAVLVLAIQSSAQDDSARTDQESQRLMAELIVGARLYPNLDSANGIINRIAGNLAAPQEKNLRTTARNHAMDFERLRGGFAATVWLNRNQNGPFYRYSKQGNAISQLCDGTEACSNSGEWLLRAEFCPEGIKARCQTANIKQ